MNIIYETGRNHSKTVFANYICQDIMKSDKKIDNIEQGEGLLAFIRQNQKDNRLYTQWTPEWFHEQIKSLENPKYQENKYILNQYEIELEMLQEDLLAEDLHSNMKYKYRLQIKSLKKLIKELKKKL